MDLDQSIDDRVLQESVCLLLEPRQECGHCLGPADPAESLGRLAPDGRGAGCDQNEERATARGSRCKPSV